MGEVVCRLPKSARAEKGELADRQRGLIKHNAGRHLVRARLVREATWYADVSCWHGGVGALRVTQRHGQDTGGKEGVGRHAAEA